MPTPADAKTFSISDCQTPSRRKLFERTAEAIHKTDPVFTPPFPGSIAKFLAPDSTFNRRHGTITAFIAERDGRPIGRIAAIVNRSHNAYHQDRTGFFGFFECVNEPAVARALFEKASAVLRAAGLETIRGPYNPSINDDCGVLMNGFDKPTMIGLPWNPDYYPRLMAELGFNKARTLYVMDLPMHRLDPPERFVRIIERLKKRANLTMRPFNLTKIEQELEIVRRVYNATLERNWGFVPIGMEDLLDSAEDIRAIADPRLLLIGESNGESAGVAIVLPNFNEILHAARNTPHWLRLAHIFLLMKTRKIRTCRQTVLGVVPEFRDRGLHAWLVHEQFREAKQLHTHATLGWLEDTNAEIIEICRVVGGETDREWGIFEKRLA
jgi:GNAT superfamily N-acetyltransferase